MTNKRRGRPSRETTGEIDLPDYKPGLDVHSQMQMMSEAAFRVAYAQLQSGKIAPSTLNKLLDYGTPDNELKMKLMGAKTTLDETKVAQIEASNKERIGHLQVIESIKGYRGNTFDDQEVTDFIG